MRWLRLDPVELTTNYEHPNESCNFYGWLPEIQLKFKTKLVPLILIPSPKSRNRDWCPIEEKLWYSSETYCFNSSFDFEEEEVLFRCEDCVLDWEPRLLQWLAKLQTLMEKVKANKGRRKEIQNETAWSLNLMQCCVVWQKCFWGTIEDKIMNMGIFVFNTSSFLIYWFSFLGAE